MKRLLASAVAALLVGALAALRPPAGPAVIIAAPALVGDGQLRKSASAVSAGVGAPVTYTITITNYSGLDDTFTLVDTLPAGLTIDPTSLTGGATYNAAAREVRWSGPLAGSSGYQLSDSRTGGRSFAYQDVSGVSGSSLCSDTLCDDSIVTGIASGGRTIDFYNTPYTTWKASSNGYIQPSAGAQFASALPAPIPSAAVPNQFFAGLWSDLDLDGTNPSDTGGGSWHKAFISGVDPARPADVFMVIQWKNAQIYGDNASSLNFEIIARTGRHGEICALYGSPLTGDLARGADEGPDYSGVLVGIEDAAGSSGLQAYYSNVGTTLGAAPAPGTTICAVPNASNGKTITYRASASAPGTLTNTVTGSSTGQGALDPASASVLFTGPTATFTNTPTPSNTATNKPSDTATQTPSDTPTGTPPTATNTSTGTPSDTATTTATSTPSDTATATATDTPHAATSTATGATTAATSTITPTATSTTAAAPDRHTLFLPTVQR